MALLLPASPATGVGLRSDFMVYNYLSVASGDDTRLIHIDTDLVQAFLWTELFCLYSTDFAWRLSWLYMDVDVAFLSRTCIIVEMYR